DADTSRSGAPAGTAPSSIQQEQQALATAQAQLATARSALTADRAALAQDRAALAAARATEAVDCAGANAAETAPSNSGGGGGGGGGGSPACPRVRQAVPPRLHAAGPVHSQVHGRQTPGPVRLDRRVACRTRS